MTNPAAPRFSLVQLQSFVAIAEDLCFRKAAQRLHIAPSSLTAQMHVLEDALGVSLFTRSRRSVNLTRAGALLVDEARDMLLHADQLIKTAGTAAHRRRSGRIVIGISRELAEPVHGVAQEFVRHFPEVNLEYRELSSSAQVNALRDRKIDISFLRTPHRPAQVNSALLFSQPLVVILPKSHPLAKEKKVTVSQLVHETLFVRSRETGSAEHDQILQLYRSSGLDAKIVETTLSPQFIADMRVATGKGIYILPEKVVDTSGNLIAIGLDDPQAVRNVYMAWRRGKSPAPLVEFIATAQHFFARQSLASSEQPTLPQRRVS